MLRICYGAPQRCLVASCNSTANRLLEICYKILSCGSCVRFASRQAIGVATRANAKYAKSETRKQQKSENLKIKTAASFQRPSSRQVYSISVQMWLIATLARWLSALVPQICNTNDFSLIFGKSFFNVFAIFTMFFMIFIN